MTAANCPSATGFGGPPDFLSEIPKVISWPGGRVYGYFLLFSGLRVLNQGLVRVEKVIRVPSFAAAEAVEARAELAEELFKAAEKVRAVVESAHQLKELDFIHRLFLRRYDSAIDRYGELGELIALGADPEMAALGKELDDVLSAPAQSDFRS